MALEFNESAYELSHEVNHFRDFDLGWDDDLTHEPFEGEGMAITFMTRLFDYPNPVIYRADTQLVTYIDYPTTDNSWSVMSKRMLSVLKSVGELPAHRLIPIAVVDWNASREKWFNRDGQFNKETAIWNYVAVHFTEELEVFDYEKSKYITREQNGVVKGIRKVDEYVFKMSPQGLPPLFRIRETSRLFVSAEARAALKQAGIAGTRYISLRGYVNGVGDFTDVPIKLPVAA